MSVAAPGRLWPDCNGFRPLPHDTQSDPDENRKSLAEMGFNERRGALCRRSSDTTLVHFGPSAPQGMGVQLEDARRSD
jgi:hypothetical protein